MSKPWMRFLQLDKQDTKAGTMPGDQTRVSITLFMPTYQAGRNNDDLESHRDEILYMTMDVETAEALVNQMQVAVADARNAS